ncbi:hypothetical protein LTR55_012300, partial [Exophiala xenobiotica]
MPKPKIQLLPVDGDELSIYKLMDEHRVLNGTDGLQQRKKLPNYRSPSAPYFNTILSNLTRPILFLEYNQLIFTL